MCDETRAKVACAKSFTLPSRAMRDDTRALELVQRFGRVGTAFQVMSPGLVHWFDAAPGLVAYADTGSAWVAAGEPVCAPANAVGVAERFVAAARAAHRRVSFFGTEGVLASSPNFARVQLGEQPVWDPRLWDAHVRSHRSLREQLRRARAKGVRIRVITETDLDNEPSVRLQLHGVVRHWLAMKPMPPMHFLVEVAPLSWLSHRRLFIAEREGTIVGLLSLAPVPARDGWLLEHLLRDPSAPNGTSESLVDAAMRALASDNIPWATLGLAPLAGDVAPWLRWTRDVMRPLFNFNGLAAFKRKLRPQSWSPIYLAYPAGTSSVVALRDGLRAFAGGALWRFGVRAMLRGPRPLLTALERLLVPWTFLLAAAPTATWFPNAPIKWAWVGFDVALYLLLRAVRRRNWIAGAGVAAMAVSADAILTVFQAVLFNIPRATRWLEYAAILVACVAPLLTAIILWGARRRLRDVRLDSPVHAARLASHA